MFDKIAAICGEQTARALEARFAELERRVAELESQSAPPSVRHFSKHSQQESGNKFDTGDE